MVKDRRMVVREPFHHPLDNKYSYMVSESVWSTFHDDVIVSDCHNNTFLAVRTINDMYDNIYAQFYLTGN